MGRYSVPILYPQNQNNPTRETRKPITKLEQHPLVPTTAHNLTLLFSGFSNTLPLAFNTLNPYQTIDSEQDGITRLSDLRCSQSAIFGSSSSICCRNKKMLTYIFRHRPVLHPVSVWDNFCFIVFLLHGFYSCFW